MNGQKGMNFKEFILAFIFLCLSANITIAQNEKLSVFVSILPQKYFAEKLLGENGNIEVLIGPGQSPHTYEPLPQQMGKLSRSDIFFTVGIPFEKALMGKLVNLCPNLKVIASDDGIEKRIMTEEHAYHEEHANHEHHEESGHHHEEVHHHGVGEKDPHFWLDPEKALAMAENMAKAFVTAKPELQPSIETNLEGLKQELSSLTAELNKTLLPYKGQTMLVFHPAFGYFADKFGLVQKSVEIEGKEPAPKQLAELIKNCRAEGIKVIFVQKQFPATTAKTIADSIGGKVIAIDPLAEDYIQNLKSMADLVAVPAN